MFERFTTQSRRVIVLAQEEARLLNHNHIGTEHLLLGLLHAGRGAAARARRDRLSAVGWRAVGSRPLPGEASPGQSSYSHRCAAVMPARLCGSSPSWAASSLIRAAASRSVQPYACRHAFRGRIRYRRANSAAMVASSRPCSRSCWRSAFCCARSLSLGRATPSLPGCVTSAPTNCLYTSVTYFRRKIPQCASSD